MFWVQRIRQIARAARGQGGIAWQSLLAVFQVPTANALQFLTDRSPHRGRRALFGGLSALRVEPVALLVRPSHCTQILWREMLLQTGANGSGVDGIGENALAANVPGQADRKQGASGFGLPIGFPFVIGTVLIVDIIEVDIREAMPSG